MPFAVRVRSHEDQEGSVVEEGLLEISHFVDAFAELARHPADDPVPGDGHARRASPTVLDGSMVQEPMTTTIGDGAAASTAP